MDPGSRPESQRVASCANRLVVTSGAYREDVEVRHTGKTEKEVITWAGQWIPASRNALEMVRALWLI